MSLYSSLNKFLAFAYKNWVMSRRNVFTIFEIAFWPVVGFLSVGLMSRYLVLSDEQTAFILIGAVTFSSVQVCQLDVGYSLLFDVWSKSIKHTFATPTEPYHYILGSSLVGALRALAVLIILSSLGNLFFGFNILAIELKALLLIFLAIILSAISIGMLVCISVLLVGLRAEVAAWSIVWLYLLLGGIYYPPSVLPKSLQLISDFIPLTHLLSYFRSFYLGSPLHHEISMTFLLLAIHISLTAVLLKIATDHALKSGLILRVSE
ncbi:MAG: ABC transporter permease [Archaeoglobi archaeon]|nr:ABC transporter permease [Candidatus Mnemosynella sp.]